MGPMVIKKGVPSISVGKLARYALLLLLTAGVHTAWAATDFLIMPPVMAGEGYTGTGAAPDRYNPVTQVAGESFSIVVYSYNNGTNLPVNSNQATTALTCPSASPVFSAPNPTLNQIFVSVNNSATTAITTTLFPASTGNYSLTASTSGGIVGDSIAVNVQVINSFQFVIGSFTAGSSGTLTINALDASSNLCDHYSNSTGVHVYAEDAGANGAEVDLGLATFANGVATLTPTFYHATPYAHFRAVKANTPAVTTVSSNFTISTGGTSHLLILGPGQTISSGTNGGNGRSGASTTTSNQTAGNNFNMTVYACDGYWNTLTASTQVTLSSSDPAFAAPAPQTFSGSTLVFNTVNLHTSGLQTVTATDTGAGTFTTQGDSVPVVPAALDHFSISVGSNDVNAAIASPALNTTLAVAAYDVYGNLLSTVSGTTVLTVLQGGAILKPGVSTYGVGAGNGTTTLTAFSNGVFTGNLFVRKVGFNYSVRITNGTVVSNSAVTFLVSPPTGTPTRWLVSMPGETLTPGELNGTIWGRNGTASSVTAGVPVNVSVLATDTYGNNMASASTVSTVLYATDSHAVFSLTSPFTVPGNNLLTMQLSAASTQQRLTITGGTPTDGNTGFFTIGANGLDHFTVGNIGASQIAGTPFTAIITAMDIYNNPVPGFTGPVYITSPQADYHSPEQSVISVVGGTNATGVTWTVNTGFNSGVWTSTNNMTVFRATTTTISVSSNADGTGSTGTSIAFTVSPAVMTKVFIIVPGLKYRPGTGGGSGIQTGGFVGTPDAQQTGSGAAFYVTVYATDYWWNQVSAGTGSNDPFRLFTAPPTSSVGGTPGTLLNFTGGKLNYSMYFTNSDSYTLTVHDTTGGITDYTTGYFIPATSINHFTLNSLDGLTWAQLPGNVIAGVPFNVSITAFSSLDDSVVVTNFNGQANLTTTGDYVEPFRVISPQRVTFVNGKWGGQVTVYRQVFSGLSVNCSVGSLKSSGTTTLTVHANARKKMLIIAPGMNPMPGISPDTYPPGGFPGYTGNPQKVEAGAKYDMDFYLCDQYWNTVTNTAQGGNHVISVTSTDPYPAWLGSPMPVTVTLTADLGLPAGAYRGKFSLYTLGINGYQSVTVHDTNDSGVADFTLGGNGVPPINIYHADLALEPGIKNIHAFNIQPVSATGRLMAGVPFWCTITAQDIYGNPMDTRNGAVAFDPTNNVNLGLGSASNTLYPTIVQLTNNGSGSFFLTAYKRYQGLGNTVNADYSDSDGDHKGWSLPFPVDSNVFKRLVPIVSGQTLNEGVYVSQPPTQFLGYLGSPLTQIAGTPVTFQVKACDAYCNLTSGATDLVAVTTTDVYAAVPKPVPLIWNSGIADFNANILDPFDFHRAAPATITVSDKSNASILSGTTPLIPVSAASPFALLSLAPGQVLVEGSGNSNISATTGGTPIGGVVDGGWFAGVTPAVVPQNNASDVYAASSVLSGVFFPVTVQATDVYGNPVSINDNFQLKTNSETDASATPNKSVPLSGNHLTNGTCVVSSKLITYPEQQNLFPWDTSNLTYNPASGGNAFSDVYVTTLGQTHFIIYINGISTGGPVYVQAAPKTFTVRVEVHDDYNDLIVSSASNVGFILQAFTDPAAATPGNGSLLITSGQTLNGGETLTETYTVAEPIYIRVKEITGAATPKLRISPEVIVTAGGPARINMSSDATNAGGVYEMEANDIKNISAQVLDSNNNPISGDNINFSIASSFASRLWNGASGVTGTAATSSVSGIATTGFKAEGNEVARVLATSSLDPTISNFLDMHISVTKDGGVYPNPFNPSSTDQKNWGHIDYRLDQAAPVKIYIYTLFGDLVWHKEISAGAEGANAGVNTTVWNGKNDNGVTVANGGYIISVKVNDQQKYRFKIGLYKH
jgi:hypothetical protein